MPSCTGITQSRDRFGSSSSPIALRSGHRVGRRTAWTPRRCAQGYMSRVTRTFTPRIADAQLGTRAGTGIRRIARLLREHSGQKLDIRISDAEVLLALPRGPLTPAGTLTAQGRL